MDLHSDTSNPCGLKVPVIKLARCDKIWKTLQLIKNTQEQYLDVIQNEIKEEPLTSEENKNNKHPMIFIPDKSLPFKLITENNSPSRYIEYQPVFSYGNDLPQFKLAEKHRVNLYHCEVCGKEFDYKSFADHQKQAHEIKLPKKIVIKKDRPPDRLADLKNSQNVKSNHVQLNKKLVLDENVDLQTVREKLSSTNNVKCRLCHKSYKDIRKHLMQNHNIILISKNVTSAVQNTKNFLKRKISTSNIGLCKKLRSINAQEEKSRSEGQMDPLKCKVCDKEYTKYSAFCKHKDKHQTQETSEPNLEIKKKVNQSINSVSKSEVNLDILSSDALVQDKDDSNIDHKVQQIRSNFNKEHGNSTDILQNGTIEPLIKETEEKFQNEYVCSRSFRNKWTLVAHKSNCKFRKNVDTHKSLEPQPNEDKNSGISIRIKKRNNSYEIVSKEGNDDSTNIRKGPSVSSTNDSDNSISNPSENLIPETSKYSKDHRIIKLTLVEEDVDVEIEEESNETDCCITAENNNSDISCKDKPQVPLLSNSCDKALNQQDVTSKEDTIHECQYCQMSIGSKEELIRHIAKHRSVMKRSCTCAIKFSNISEFDDHIAAVHSKCTVCPYCEKKFKTIIGCIEHTCVIDQGKPYLETLNENHPCPICNIVCNNILSLDSHVRSNHLDPNLKFQCYRCLEKFPNRKEKRLHLRRRHSSLSVCSICNQKFRNIKIKQDHEAYHRGVGFPCHICKKTYRLKNDQLQHVSVHSNFVNDKLECLVCGKKIKYFSLEKHMLRHNSKLES